MAHNLALIGCGNWGKNHKKLLENREDIHLSYVCDAVIEERMEERTKFVRDYKKVLEDYSVEAVVIATPAKTHFEIAKDALEAGKHVLVEKPMTQTSEEAEKLIEIAEKSGKQLMVGHVFMYNPAIQYLKQSIERGELGKILHINVRRFSPGVLKERVREDNVLVDAGLHDLSMFLYLIGAKPKIINVSGNSLSELSGNLEDIATLNLKFDNDVTCSLIVSWAYPGIVKKLTAIGDKNTAIFDDVSSEKLIFYKFGLQKSNRATPGKEFPSFSPSLSNISPLEAQLNHFLECIRDNKTPLSDGNNGLEIVRLIEHIEESMKNKSKQEVRNKDYFVSDKSIVNEFVEMGKGASVWHFCNIFGNEKNSVKIGENTQIGNYCEIMPGARIGSYCKIRTNVFIPENAVIGNYVFISPGAVLMDDKYPSGLKRFVRKWVPEPPIIEDRVTIGGGALIGPGVRIGYGSVIGMGAVITKDIEPYSVVIENNKKIGDIRDERFKNKYEELLE